MAGGTQTFKEAVLDMGALFKEMKTKYAIPPAVTLDIVRLQMMFMTQQQQQQMAVQQNPIEDFDADEVIGAEDEALDG